MKATALNFSTEAIGDLEQGSSNFEPDQPRSAKNIRRVAGLLRRAIKFILPDNGVLFDDGLRALPAAFRLPYPIIAAEYSMQTEATGAGPLATTGEPLSQSSKRIALAVEVNASNFDSYSWMLSDRHFDVLSEDGAVVVMSIFFSDQHRRWVLPPMGLAVPAVKLAPSSASLANSVEMYGGELPQGTAQLPLVAYAVDLLPEQAQAIESKGGLSAALATAHQDTHDELLATLGLIEVLSCSNVGTDMLKAPALINSKREKKGKVPFFEYRILQLTLPEEDNGPPSQPTGSHASPRVHLRRGHIRRLPGKTIWVNAAVVGDKRRGAVIKDYSVSVSDQRQ